MSDDLKITLLGTGIPNPNINAFGTSTLVEVGEIKVLLDCGRGAVMRLWQAGHTLGSVDTVILSHYHSDHYVGLLDLLMTGAIPQKAWAGRDKPLDVYGPKGLQALVNGAWQMAEPDRDIRVADGEMQGEIMRINPHIYEDEGVIFEKDGLRIIAIEVDHGEFIKPAYAFRVEYKGHVFVHSHDTRYNQNLITQAEGADVFVHEVAAARPETMERYPKVKIAIDHHSSPKDVGRVFSRTRPKLAMLTHIVLLPPNPVTIDEVLDELSTEYDGPVVVAEDLMTICIGRNISVTPYRHGGHDPNGRGGGQ